jgi:DNA-binding CsgD family transcriptional regulator
MEENIMKRDQFAVQSISGREREIFLSLLEGCTNQEIASSLGICQKTVEEHLTSVYRKIGVKTRSQAILWWVSGIKGIPSLTRKRIRRK